LGAVRGAWAVTDDDDSDAPVKVNPYAVIIDKNVFRLNPPPPLEPPPEVKPADLPQYKLTGIVNISGETRVLFALAPKDAKDTPTYLNLAAGEKQGQLELVSIDRDKEEVAVINSGTPMTLSVKSNSYAVSAGAAPAAPGPIPGARRLPGFPAPPIPGAPPPAPAPATAAASQPSTGGAVIIGGGGDGGGANSGVAQNNQNYAAQNVGNYGGGNYGGSGVSVSGAAPINYGGVGGVNLATPNGATINLGSTAPVGQTPNWPPPTTEPVNPALQILEMQAASQGINTGNNGSPANSGKTGPPMPPVMGLNGQTKP
jgi:hypothetical protein